MQTEKKYFTVHVHSVHKEVATHKNNLIITYSLIHVLNTCHQLMLTIQSGASLHMKVSFLMNAHLDYS